MSEVFEDGRSGLSADEETTEWVKGKRKAMLEEPEGKAGQDESGGDGADWSEWANGVWPGKTPARLKPWLVSGAQEEPENADDDHGERVCYSYRWSRPSRRRGGRDSLVIVDAAGETWEWAGCNLARYTAGRSDGPALERLANADAFISAIPASDLVKDDYRLGNMLGRLELVIGSIRKESSRVVPICVVLTQCDVRGSPDAAIIALGLRNVESGEPVVRMNNMQPGVAELMRFAYRMRRQGCSVDFQAVSVLQWWRDSNAVSDRGARELCRPEAFDPRLSDPSPRSIVDWCLDRVVDW
jgi:hypothetical protein